MQYICICCQDPRRSTYPICSQGSSMQANRISGQNGNTLVLLGLVESSLAETLPLNEVRQIHVNSRMLSTIDETYVNVVMPEG
ncbi:predicted protein [Sclerotinia sclerotiorum 1980 UF-70]|uniref:Uncharacterized protein n=1 Tax=Sclerotinia sclerotiorum (strain ATCC 18683 / 1980 / Ss-1) TaxID=665079 RepID=A7EI73_SCLS1|nr:predicted protein [Sclerotinia sclerotiorum 1980 UF-70]EDO02539.1 predicted protein [Sclerotinia sclerotiorum 1980 UF-70]